MKNRIGFCGLDCETCDAYMATVHNDQQLREKTAKLWAELNHAPILPEDIYCEGCRNNGVKTIFCQKLCTVRQCALEKGVDTCKDCRNLESCSTVGAIIAHNPEILKNLTGDITIRPETHKDFKEIISLVLRSFQEGTDYSDGTDIIALIEEIRDSEYYIPELSFVAESQGKIVGYFMFSRFPISSTPDGKPVDDGNEKNIVMLAPVAVHADYFHQGVGFSMIKQGIEKVRQAGYRGITVEGDYHFYNRVGFKTSSEYNLFPTSGIPMKEPRCMMCQEMYEGALKNTRGYIVYSMYYNA